jgi:hypothetical protein
MKLDQSDINEFLDRFDAKFEEARQKYKRYLSNDVRLGDYFNVTFTFSLTSGESSVRETKGNYGK